jgi:hypothetical protein
MLVVMVTAVIVGTALIALMRCRRGIAIAQRDSRAPVRAPVDRCQHEPGGHERAQTEHRQDDWHTAVRCRTRRRLAHWTSHAEPRHAPILPDPAGKMMTTAPPANCHCKQVQRGFAGQQFHASRVTCMTRLIIFTGFVLSLLVAGPTAFAQALGWPRTVEQPSGKVVLFEPHVDSWDSDLVWRQAFQLTPAGGTMTAGAASFEGSTSNNPETRIVTISATQITGAYFPGLDRSASAPLIALLRSMLPPTIDISLEQLVTYMRTPASLKVAPDAASPPIILVSYAPVVVLRVHGPPVLKPVPGTRLKYVANTSWALFQYSANGHFYLLANNVWFEAGSLDGAWRRVTRLPEDFRHMPADDRFAPVRRFVPPPPVREAGVPKVLYSTSAVDVILFDGLPAYASIAGTRLERATHTRSPVFRYNAGQSYFYLTSRGRWFSAPSLKGPWTDTTAALPADFANIPPDSPAAAVLVAVPGTRQSEDAALLAQVPKTPAPSAAQVSVSYDGTPQFLPVEGTTMQYASNTADKVLRVGDVYYLKRRGAWFIAPAPQGPWAAASGPPEVIYTIPPSSPAFTVTYVSYGYEGYEDFKDYENYMEFGGTPIRPN